MEVLKGSLDSRPYLTNQGKLIVVQFPPWPTRRDDRVWAYRRFFSRSPLKVTGMGEVSSVSVALTSAGPRGWISTGKEKGVNPWPRRGKRGEFMISMGVRFFGARKGSLYCGPSCM